jgi:hypothetical protein
MKKRALRALGALALLPVFAGFLAACQETYQPVLLGVDIFFDEKYKNPGDDSDYLLPYINKGKVPFTVTVKAPVGVTSTVTVSINKGEETDWKKKIEFLKLDTVDANLGSGYFTNDDDDDISDISQKAVVVGAQDQFTISVVTIKAGGPTTITIKADPGGITKSITVKVFN